MSRDDMALEAAFISANAAGYIASTYTATVKGSRPPALTLDPPALRSLNAFLDYLLAIIIKGARSTELQQLKATFSRVLDSALGYVALNEAQAELETYRNQETGAGRAYDNERSPMAEVDGSDFDVEKVWLQARIRCMIYSTVGEKEETDFPVLPSEGPYVTPPVAIFLTAVLEFLGEHILLTAARFARDRVGTNSKGVLYEKDLDQGIRMDRSLGTIWEVYLSILPMRTSVVRDSASRDTLASNANGSVFTTLPFTQMGTVRESVLLQNPDQYEQLPSSQDPSLTPVILRKSSPGIPTLRSSVPLQSTSNVQTDHTSLHKLPPPLVSNDSDTIGHDSLETIPEAPPNQLGTQSDSVQGPDDVMPAPLNPSSRTLVGLVSSNDREQTRMRDTSTTIPSHRESVLPDVSLQETQYSHPPQEQHEDRPPRESVVADPGASNTPNNDNSTSPQAVRVSPSQTRGGFESGLFQWNAQRESKAHDNKLHQFQKTPTKSLVNSSNNFASSASNIAEPSLLETNSSRRTRSSNTSPSSSIVVSPTREPPVRYGTDHTVGLGLRSVSAEEPKSDLYTFLRTESEQETKPLVVSNAEAQRNRIIASRESALGARKNPPTSPRFNKSEEVSKAPVVEKNGHPDRSSLKTKSSPGSIPREPSISLDSSHTLRLAEFLRNTGPETASMSPRTEPLSPSARVKGSPGDKSQTMKSPKPEKTTRAGSRMALETSSDTDNSEWDEELYGPKPTDPAARQESLVEFLREGPIPPSGIRQSQTVSELAGPPRLGPLKLASPHRLTETDRCMEDDLIAGPAYNSDSDRPLGRSVVESPQLGTDVVSNSWSPTAQKVIPSSPGLLAQPSGSTRQSMTPVKSMLVSDQRASSSKATDEAEDSDDDSIYGDTRRRPAAKESLADFLRSTAPPGYHEPDSKESREVSASANASPTSSRIVSRISRRLSSFSLLVSGNNKRAEGPTSPTISPPARPNHRPLLH